MKLYLLIEYLLLQIPTQTNQHAIPPFNVVAYGLEENSTNVTRRDRLQMMLKVLSQN